LIEATRDGRISGEVARVVSDRPEAPALAAARERGVPTAVLTRAGEGTRLSPEAEAQLLEIVREDRPDLIALCGFLRLLRGSFLSQVTVPILNVHPSLLPRFRGLDAQRQAIEAGATVSGATVHYVDAGMDTGAIVMQEALEIPPATTPEGLADRLLPLEHRLYVEAIRRLQKENS